MLWYLTKPFNIFKGLSLKDFQIDYCLKTRHRLLKLVYHPKDQETLTKEDLMVIAICLMLDVWQQFKMKATKTNRFARFRLTLRVNNHFKIVSSTSPSMDSTMIQECWGRQSCDASRNQVGLVSVFNTKLSLYSWSWRQSCDSSRNQAGLV